MRLDEFILQIVLISATFWCGFVVAIFCQKEEVNKPEICSYCGETETIPDSDNVNNNDYIGI